jgi:hypothetical protein
VQERQAARVQRPPEAPPLLLWDHADEAERAGVGAAVEVRQHDAHELATEEGEAPEPVVEASMVEGALHDLVDEITGLARVQPLEQREQGASPDLAVGPPFEPRVERAGAERSGEQSLLTHRRTDDGFERRGVQGVAGRLPRLEALTRQPTPQCREELRDGRGPPTKRTNRIPCGVSSAMASAPRAPSRSRTVASSGCSAARKSA